MSFFSEESLWCCLKCARVERRDVHTAELVNPAIVNLRLWMVDVALLKAFKGVYWKLVRLIGLLKRGLGEFFL